MTDQAEMKVVLTIQQIKDLAEYAGLTVSHNPDNCDLDDYLTVVQDGLVATDDCRTEAYSGAYAYFSDYPEEGSLPLNNNIVSCVEE